MNLLGQSNDCIFVISEFLDPVDTYALFHTCRTLRDQAGTFAKCMKQRVEHTHVDLFMLLLKAPPSVWRDNLLVRYLHAFSDDLLAPYLSGIFSAANVHPYNRPVISWMLAKGITTGDNSLTVYKEDLKRRREAWERAHAPPPPPPPPPPPLVEHKVNEDGAGAGAAAGAGAGAGAGAYIGLGHLTVAGNNNVAIGYQAMVGHHGGTGISFGSNAFTLPRQSHVVCIGSGSGTLCDASNCIVIGSDAQALYDGELALGSVKHPIEVISRPEGDYVRVRINGRRGMIPIIWDE